jgi:hypothetical protein
VAGERHSLQEQHDAIISSRFRYYDDWVRHVAEDRAIPLARSLSAASIALNGLSVTIDGRILTRFVTGTQLQTLELISALSEQGIAHLRIVVPWDLGDYALGILEKLRGIEVLPVDEITDATDRTDVIHRPYQVSSTNDLPLLSQLGERLVITHLDLISYFNPDYHATFERWWDYRELTKLVLATADQVVFISRHTVEAAIAEGLVDQERASVAYVGTDHRFSEVVTETRRPQTLEHLNSDPFLLCLGTDFRHKNRHFALRLLNALRERHRWNGALVLAGAHVPIGSSAGEEARYVAARPELAEVRLALPNQHHLELDLAPFGLDNPGEVYQPLERPHGLIEGTVRRGPPLPDGGPD